MTLPELHPDELLLREASSTLTPREWADLSAHLERCPACVLERAARREAARVRVPSDLDHAIAARVVSRMLAGQEREIGPVKRVGRGWGRRFAYAAIALVLVSGTAIAGVAWVTQIRQREAARVEGQRSAPQRSAPSRPAHKRQRAALATAGSSEAKRLEPSGEPLGPLPAEPSVPSSAQGSAVAAESAPAIPEPASPPAAGVAVAVRRDPGGGRAAAVSRSRSSAGRAEEARAERPRGDAATLLEQAEEAETAGRLAGASRLYGELGQSFPGTREEIVARALHGQLLLDRMGSPARALALFEAYLNAEPTGTLAEEARLGKARSLERLGRSSDERLAWLDLLRAHPRSVHAAAARARLAAIDAP